MLELVQNPNIVNSIIIWRFVFFLLHAQIEIKLREGIYHHLYSDIILHISHIFHSHLTVVSHETKENVPFNSLLMNALEYVARTNLVKMKNAIPYEP